MAAFLDTRLASSMFLAAALQQQGLAEAAWFARFKGAEMVGLARFEDGRLQVQDDSPATAVAAVAGRAVGSIVGPATQVWLAEGALELDAKAAQLRSEETLYTLDLDALVRVPGADEVRRATAIDLPSLLPLAAAYRAEILDQPVSDAIRAGERPGVEARVARGTSFVLPGGDGLKARATFNAVAGAAVQVGGVFTWPEFRGQGIGRAVVAGALSIVAAEGVLRASLFTANPQAARAYRALSFREVGRFGIAVY